MDKKCRKDQTKEILETQNYILDAVKNLNERLAAIDENLGQNIIDQIIVKNSDDISLMKKVKQENVNAIQSLESKIEELDSKLKLVNEELHKDRITESEYPKIICRYYNKLYCREKSLCKYKHPQNVCEILKKDGECFVSNFSSRHPSNCKYQKQGCFREDLCAYIHINAEQNVDHLKVIDDQLDVEKVDEDVQEGMIMNKINDDTTDVDNEISVESSHKCDKYKNEDAQNECEQRGKYFCSTCEIQVLGESVLEFFKNNDFKNYTCNTVHE